MQRERQIIEFTRDFLNDILKEFSFLEERTRERVLKDLLSRAKKTREGYIFKKYLVRGAKPYDRINQGCEERRFKDRGREVSFYTFL